MTKENAKDYLPFIQALADGKTIQFSNGDEWIDLDDPNFENSVEKYRIKPEEEYVPFDTVEELIDCWNKKKFNGKAPYNTELEMPLIWVKKKTTDTKWLITGFDVCGISINDNFYSYRKLFEEFTFLDGSQIGKIKK